MRSKMSVNKICFVFLLSVIIVAISGQAKPEEDYIPQVGQAGKDVIWVPTPQVLVDKILDVTNVTPNDYLIDLGSGDGRIVIAAAKRGTRAHGIEYEHYMVEISRRNAEKEGVSGKATFAEMDIFKSDFSQATVVTMFLLPELNLRLRPVILDLKPGTRIVSIAFDMGEWVADKIIKAEEGCTGYCAANLWIVPAKVGCTWKLREGDIIEDLILEQTFQMITGSLKSGDMSMTVNGKILGDRIRFNANGKVYVGRVSGDSMSGRYIGGSSGEWSASRIQHER